MILVNILIKPNACGRTKERFSRFKEQKHRIYVLNRKINDTLFGDGFASGEPMTYFGIDRFDTKDNLWCRAWEGWIPDNEIIIEEIFNGC